MVQELTVALKTAKEIERNLVQHENRLAFVQTELKRTTEANDSLKGEIDRKMADYNIYIAQRDMESKKFRQDVTDERNQLVKDKQEFMEIMKQFQKDKQAFTESVQGFEVAKVRNEAQMNNIREFIIAVQRACSVIGL